MRNSGFITGIPLYVVAAAGIAVVLMGFYATSQTYKARAAVADLETYKAQAEKEAAELRARAAEVSERVVIEYRDRVKEIRVPTPVEVVREIEVIRQSDCKLPAAWVRLHDAATGAGPEASGGADEAAEISCAAAIEGVRENYLRFHENAEQLKALQSWAASVSTP